MITTGVRHAGVVSNDAAAEAAVVAAGTRVGTLAFPMIYAPEILVRACISFPFFLCVMLVVW